MVSMGRLFILLIPYSFPLSVCHIFVGSMFMQRPSEGSMFSVIAWPFPGLPAKFIEDLRSQEATEGATAVLRCELSKAAPVEWRKGSETLKDGDRYTLRQDGAVCELQIHGLAVVDTGAYSCVCGQEKTSATLNINGTDVWPIGFVSWYLWAGCLTCSSHILPLCLCVTSFHDWIES